MWLEMWAKFQMIGTIIGIVALIIVFVYAFFLTTRR